MAKKGGAKKSLASGSGYQFATLREESSGKKHVKVSKNANSILRMQHLQKLAIWAAGKVSIPPLGALFGHNLASSREATGIPLDSSLFLCQRCETILQPGQNCTVRIKKNVVKTGRHKKSRVPSQNNVVYTCHFCSHENLKKGTPKGHMKEILASRSKPVGTMDQTSASPKKDSATGAEIVHLKPNSLSGSKPCSPKKKEDKADTDISTENSPSMPFGKVGVHLSKEKKRKRNRSGFKKPTQNENSSTATETAKASSGSSKRRKKAWSSLKEIAESSDRENARGIGNLTIPFFV